MLTLIWPCVILRSAECSWQVEIASFSRLVCKLLNCSSAKRVRRSTSQTRVQCLTLTSDSCIIVCGFFNWCYPVSLPPDSALSTVGSKAERGFILLWEFTYFLQKCNSTSSWVIGNMISQESRSPFCNVLWPFHWNTSTNSAFCYCLLHRWGQVMSPSASYPLSQRGNPLLPLLKRSII